MTHVTLFHAAHITDNEMSLTGFSASAVIRLPLLLLMTETALADDSGGDGGQFLICDVMWSVRRLPPISQKQPASKHAMCGVADKDPRSLRTPKSTSVGLDETTEQLQMWLIGTPSRLHLGGKSFHIREGKRL
jgi:hypothetical protein